MPESAIDMDKRRAEAIADVRAYSRLARAAALAERDAGDRRWMFRSTYHDAAEKMTKAMYSAVLAGADFEEVVKVAANPDA